MSDPNRKCDSCGWTGYPSAAFDDSMTMRDACGSCGMMLPALVAPVQELQVGTLTGKYPAPKLTQELAIVRPIALPLKAEEPTAIDGIIELAKGRLALIEAELSKLYAMEAEASKLRRMIDAYDADSVPQKPNGTRTETKSWRQPTIAKGDT